MNLAQRGDAASARKVAEQLLARSGDVAPVHAFLGMLACRSRDLRLGVEHLRMAHDARPKDITIALNLANALMENGQTAEALSICSAEYAQHDPSYRVWRLRGYLCQKMQDFAAASAAYERVLAHHPGDFETWNNLGNARSAIGDAEGSLAALENAILLRGDSAPLRLNHATALSDLGRFDEAAGVLRALADDFADDPKPLIELAGLFKRQRREDDALDALAEACRRNPADLELQVRYGTDLATNWNMEVAEKIFENVIERDPVHRDAHVRLALVYEHTNRAAALPAYISAAEAAGVDPGAVQFTHALSLRHEKRFADGIAALAATADDIEPVRQAQLLGQFQDRLGHHGAAFAAFDEMNRQLVADRPDMPALAKGYRDEIAREFDATTADWFAGWSPAAKEADRTPVFLVGFPRSGTTLLDTLLMGHPDVQVLEERPPLLTAERAIGGFEALRSADAESITAARTAYFAEVAKWTDLREGSVLIDKFPLHMSKVPLIHRLFPAARFILALRHPADVVLSCFTTNFRPNQAMSNFVDLETTASLYNMSFSFWEKVREILPVKVHEVRYERMIADAAQELKPLLEYLGLDWHEELLNHRGTAVDRGVITTASYAQVTEPIYQRSVGRWRHYTDALAPIMPILDPWIERYGYDR